MNIIPFSMGNEIAARNARIAEAMAGEGIDAMLLSSFANIYYATGRVFCGYVYITADGNATYFVKRPNDIEGENVVRIRKSRRVLVNVDNVLWAATEFINPDMLEVLDGAPDAGSETKA